MTDNHDLKGQAHKNFRATPIAVPEDWWSQMVKLKSEVNLKARALKAEVGHEEAARIMDAQEIVLFKEDALAFVETALSVPEVAEAIESQFRFHEKEPYVEAPEEWGRIRADFLRWWIYSRFEVNRHTVSGITLKYCVVTFPVLDEYFRTDDIKKTYDLFHKSACERGFSDGVKS